MKNKEKYLTNFSEAKRKEATQNYNIIEPFILSEQSLSSISKSKDIALSTFYRWNKLYKEEGLTGLIHNTRVYKGGSSNLSTFRSFKIRLNFSINCFSLFLTKTQISS